MHACRSTLSAWLLEIINFRCGILHMLETNWRDFPEVYVSPTNI